MNELSPIKSTTVRILPNWVVFYPVCESKYWYALEFLYNSSSFVTLFNVFIENYTSKESGNLTSGQSGQSYQEGGDWVPESSKILLVRATVPRSVKQKTVFIFYYNKIVKLYKIILEKIKKVNR